MADLVEEWKALARARMARETAPHPTSAPRVHVQITLGFALACAVLGLHYGMAGPVAALLGLTFVVLVQELPRAFLARVLGRGSEVRISVLGAQTAFAGAPLHGPAALAIESAGSFCNFLFAFAVLGLSLRAPAGNAARLLHALALSHAAWGGAQMLPALPFRSGQAIARGLPPRLRLTHAGASVAFNLALAALADAAGVPLLQPLIVLAAFASSAALGIEVAARADARSGASGLADQADARLRECNPAAAAELAERALAAARSPRLRRSLWTTLAWAAIGKQDPFLAHEAIASLPARALDFHLVAAYLACCNRADEAEQLLGEARGLGHRDPETTKLLIDLFVRRGNASAALELARDDDRLLSDDDRAAIEAALPTSSSAQS